MAKGPTDKLRIFDPSFSLGQLPQLTGFHLRRASMIDFSTFSNTSGETAITPQRYSVLEVVGANPGMRQIELGTVLGLSKPATTIAIDFWQARSCMVRRQSTDDARARGLHLTDAGNEMLASLQKAVVRHDRALTASLSSEELVLLHRMLRKIIDDTGG